MYKKIIILLFNSVLMFLFVYGVQGQTLWVETTQEDFKDGTYERNLYSSHRGGGAIEFVSRSDLNNDGYIDLYVSNINVPYVTVYYGSSSGYSPSNRKLFPIPLQGAGNCDAADLNQDGFADFITKGTGTGVSIFWGTPSGPDSSNLTQIPVSGSPGESCFIADFNKDGYLDIALDQFEAGKGCIFWGSVAGYDSSMRTELPVLMGRHNIEVGDLNRDGWLDILFTDSPEYPIYWGNPLGFSETNRTMLPVHDTLDPHGLSIADLNNDGFLEIITTAIHKNGSQIFWGSSSGYSPGSETMLNPGACYGGSVLADLNVDGSLDIIYHRGPGQVLQKIYWGSTGGHSDTNVSEVGLPLVACGGITAHFNGDEFLDLFITGLGTESYILWGPDYSTNTPLPTNRDNHGMFREIGNVYTRAYEESYLSSVFDAGFVMDWGIITWMDSLTPGSEIIMSLRSGGTSIPDTSWSSWITLLNGESIPESLNARYLQYRSEFIYTNPASLPVLFEVSISLLTGIFEGPRSNPNNTSFILRQNNPNPFNKLTAISYQLKAPAHTSLKIYDLTGRLVTTLLNEHQKPGIYQVQWDGKKQASGIYFYRLQTGNVTSTKKLILLK
jgi:hypothetical protein